MHKNACTEKSPSLKWLWVFFFPLLSLYLRTSRISPKPPRFGVEKEGMTFFSEGQGKGKGEGQVKNKLQEGTMKHLKVQYSRTDTAPFKHPQDTSPPPSLPHPSV